MLLSRLRRASVRPKIPDVPLDATGDRRVELRDQEYSYVLPCTLTAAGAAFCRAIDPRCRDRGRASSF
jgi:hypothetical protein